MSAQEWLSKNIETLGITLAFSFFGSSMLLWVTAEKQPLSVNRAGMVIVAGQLVGSSAALFVFGYLLWPWFVSPVVGVVAGIAAIPIIRSLMKAVARGEDRASDIADGALNRIVGREQDRMDRSAERRDDRIDKIADRAEDRKDAAGKGSP